MPAFTAISLDRLFEPGSGTPSPRKPPRPPLVPVKVDRAAQETTIRRHIPRPNISPALYVTPESTPLPDSPSSPPHSPYIVNRKGRGPRPVKSLLQSKASGTVPRPPAAEEKIEVVNGNGHDGEEQKGGDGQVSQDASVVYEFDGGELQDEKLGKGMIGAEEFVKPRSDDIERVEDTEGFFDLQDSLSNASNSEVDDSCGWWKPTTPLAEYYDALDEISSDGTAQSFFQNDEDELHEMRLTVLMEIEKRKQAEEALENLQNQRQRLSKYLSLVGLKLPIPSIVSEGMDVLSNLDPAEEFSRQIVVASFVADAVGRVCAHAEVEREVEPQIVSKNFEIATLWDRLHYYEAANREMSQRNQEAVQIARQQCNRSKMRQKWLWSSICLATTIGGAAMAWSYLPLSKPTPSECYSTSRHEQ